MPLSYEISYRYQNGKYGPVSHLHPSAASDDVFANPHSIAHLGLSVRAWHCLTSAGIYNLHRVLAMSNRELLGLQRCGPQTVANIRQAIRDYRVLGSWEDRRASYYGHL